LPSSSYPLYIVFLCIPLFAPLTHSLLLPLPRIQLAIHSFILYRSTSRSHCPIDRQRTMTFCSVRGRGAGGEDGNEIYCNAPLTMHLSPRYKFLCGPGESTHARLRSIRLPAFSASSLMSSFTVLLAADDNFDLFRPHPSPLFNNPMRGPPAAWHIRRVHAPLPPPSFFLHSSLQSFPSRNLARLHRSPIL